MKWILIIILQTSGGRAATVAEFDSIHECEKAASWVMSTGWGAVARCFPKK
jgi:hypothetical protein